jgi:hypothetical protein
MSPKNKEKFINVFEVYSSEQDTLKLKAAYYIAENINDFGAYYCEELKKYDTIFDILASKPRDFREKLPWYSKVVDNMLDSLESVYGDLDTKKLFFIEDADVFTSTGIINHINASFEALNQPWNRNLSFEDFCEYILPYRNGKELLENWRTLFLTEYNWVWDSLPGNPSMLELASVLNRGAEVKFADGIGRYPTPISPSNLIKGRFGTCNDIATYRTLLFRSFGIPICTDFFPQWGNDRNSHYWNAILDSAGELTSMDKVIGDINASVAYKFQIAKVYRKTFSKQKEMVELQNCNPGSMYPDFFDLRITDVTGKYVPVSTVELATDKMSTENSMVYLCVFNNKGFTPIAISVCKEGKAVFKKVGRQVMYFPMYFQNNTLIPAGNAFFIDVKGGIQYKIPKESNKQLVLTRKYHMHSRKLDWLKCLVNGKFEGANNADYSDAVTLAIIKQIPSQHYEELVVNNMRKFKFYRFLFHQSELELGYDGGGAGIAEIEFIDAKGEILTGQPQGTDANNYSEYTPDKCFDGKVLTFFEDPSRNTEGKWVGLELDKGASISKIRYCARNDMNCVQKDDLYELQYWNNKQFVTLGQQLAIDTLVTFYNCPLNAVFLLRNLSGGKEERIFTYENNKQVWW